MFFLSIAFFDLRLEYAYVFCNLRVFLGWSCICKYHPHCWRLNPSKTFFRFITNLSIFRIIYSLQNVKSVLILKAMVTQCLDVAILPVNMQWYRVYADWKVRENHIKITWSLESQGKSGNLKKMLCLVRESQGIFFPNIWNEN